MTIGYKKAYDRSKDQFVVVEIEIADDTNKYVSERTIDGDKQAVAENNAALKAEEAAAKPDKKRSWLISCRYEKTFQYGDLDRKCRAEKATVKKIHGGSTTAQSLYDGSFLYQEGKEVQGDTKQAWEPGACGNGIHYFADIRDAIAYDTGTYMNDRGHSAKGVSKGFWYFFEKDDRPDEKWVHYRMTEDAVCDDPTIDIRKEEREEKARLAREAAEAALKKAEQAEAEALAKNHKEAVRFHVYKDEGDTSTLVQTCWSEEAANLAITEGRGTRFVKVQPV